LEQKIFGGHFVSQIGLENTQAGVCALTIQGQAFLCRLQSLGFRTSVMHSHVPSGARKPQGNFAA
jgi:hypothetical protein